MRFIHLVFIVFVCIVLFACGDESPQQTAPKAQSSEVIENTKAPAKKESNPSLSTGGVAVEILPENPTSTGCLQAIIQGTPGRSGVSWLVNGEVVSSGTGTQMCSDKYKRYDTVTIQVGTVEMGAQASVSIGNSPPRVINLSSSPSDIYAGTDVTVTPVAEDADGDSVDFTYQWLINGEADPALSEATLPGNKFNKGDTVQVFIIPNDFYDDGPTYKSYEQPIFNASPLITSEPPQGIASLDYRYQVEVTDPDDSTFTYRLDEAPEGMTIDETSGLIKWSLVDVEPGDYTIAIIAADAEGVETAQEYTLSLGTPQ